MLLDMTRPWHRRKSVLGFRMMKAQIPAELLPSYNILEYIFNLSVCSSEEKEKKKKDIRFILLGCYKD